MNHSLAMLCQHLIHEMEDLLFSANWEYGDDATIRAEAREEVEQYRRMLAAVLMPADTTPAARPLISITVDGACSGNPGPGGWAAIFEDELGQWQLSGHADATTNNRMELTAVLEALYSLKQPSNVVFHTDSQNVIGWLDGGFKRNQPDIARLCAAIDNAAQVGGHIVSFEKVKGHSGHQLNDEADALAKSRVRG